MNKFALGHITATPGALDALSEMPDGVTQFHSMVFVRHARGDWGDLSDGDKKQNDDALKNGDSRIFSAYVVNGTKFWVITEWDKSATTILLPSEY